MASTGKHRVGAHDARRAARPALAVIGMFVLAIFVHGCATTPDAQEARGDREYRTGSNIPVRDRASATDSKSYDPASVQDAVRRSVPPTPLGARGG